MKLREIVGLLNVIEVRGDLDTEFDGITSDTRRLQAGDVFFAISGGRTSGNDYIGEAVDKGASAVVTEEDLAARGVPLLRVEDIRNGMGCVAHHYYGYPARSMTCTGITGTNGKTTTSYMIDAVLKQRFDKTAVIGTLGLVYGDSHRSFGFTTPESPVIASQLAWLANDGCRAMTMEVSSHGLALGRVSGLEFDLAVFTNLTRDHLDFHGDMERYLEAKLLLFRGLGMGEKGGNGVVNLDDPQAARFIQATSAKTLTYGIDAVEADVSVVDHRLYPWGSEVTVQSPLGVSSLDVRIPGRFNVANALAAFAAGIALGASENEIVRGIGSVDRVRGRMELLEGKGIRVVIDYAHTPEAIVKLLTTLGEIYPAGRIITVVGCGGERDVEKRPMMGEAAARLSQVLVLTSDNPRGEDPEAILDDLEQGVRRVREDYTRLTDREEAIRYAIGRAAVGDVVVIAGKGHEDYQIIGGKRYPFDDREVSRKVLAATGEDRESRGGGRV